VSRRGARDQTDQSELSSSSCTSFPSPSLLLKFAPGLNLSFVSASSFQPAFTSPGSPCLWPALIAARARASAPAGRRVPELVWGCRSSGVELLGFCLSRSELGRSRSRMAARSYQRTSNNMVEAARAPVKMAGSSGREAPLAGVPPGRTISRPTNRNSLSGHLRLGRNQRGSELGFGDLIRGRHHISELWTVRRSSFGPNADVDFGRIVQTKTFASGEASSSRNAASSVIRSNSPQTRS
jgi:hypothetical protein